MKEKILLFYSKHKEVLLYICLPLLLLVLWASGKKVISFDEWFLKLKKRNFLLNKIASYDPEILVVSCTNRIPLGSVYSVEQLAKNFDLKVQKSAVLEDTLLRLDKSFNYHFNLSSISIIPTPDYGRRGFANGYEKAGAVISVSDLNKSFAEFRTKYVDSLPVVDAERNERINKNMNFNIAFKGPNNYNLYSFVVNFDLNNFSVLGLEFEYDGVMLVIEGSCIHFFKTVNGLHFKRPYNERIVVSYEMGLYIENSELLNKIKDLFKKVFVNDKGQIIEL